MDEAESGKKVDLEELRIANEIASGFRDLHIHENDLLNHRFQWFGLMTGLLAATYGLLWEFKSTAELPMVALSVFGFFVSFSASLGSIFTRRAHDQIDDIYDSIIREHRDLIRVPIRGLKYSPKWRFFLPWNAMFPAFCVFWVILGLFAANCDCPKDGGANSIESTSNP